MPRQLDRGLVGEALAAAGELLAAESERISVVVTGGATLNLLGIVQRTTSDVDVIARASRDGAGNLRLERAEPFPSLLEKAIRTVARDLDLDEHWMNAGVGKQWSYGLPPRIEDDITWENYGGGLDVGLVGRRTLIALKLFAAADTGPNSVHNQDLIELGPTDEELAEARNWVVTQDAAQRWPEIVDEAIENAKRDH